MTSVTPHWIDRVTAPFAPRWTLKRQLARRAGALLQRHYEGAAVGRRTQGWNRSGTDANAAAGPALAYLRAVARDLVRNNPYAKRGVTTIVNQTVGWGIDAKPVPKNGRAADAWRAWAGTTACDADGRHDFAGLQKLVMRAVVTDGEVLVRRRFRRPEDNLPIPLQLQVLEADYLDTFKHGIKLPNGGRIDYGIERDVLGRRAAYWLFPEHPGNATAVFGASQRVPADAMLHIFMCDRPGASRGASWFAPVLLRFKDFDEYEDATLMKQKIAACLTVIQTDVDGSGPSIGTADDTATPPIDMLEPGAIISAPPGRSIEIVQPPQTGEYDAFSTKVLRGVAAGLLLTHADVSGDYTDMPFSAAKLSLLQHWPDVEDWRWQMLVPQFCDPVWAWAMQAAMVASLGETVPQARWSPPPMPMIEPDKEGLAYQRNIRTGLLSLSEAIRERGYDPDDVLEEIAADNKKLDALGITLDSDARKTTQAGQKQQEAKPTADAPAAPPPASDEDDEDAERRVRDLLKDLGPDHAIDLFKQLYR